MNRLIVRVSTAGVLLAALLAAGCGGANVVPTKGIVTLDGKPLEGANVNFLPEVASAKSQPAQAMTKADGTFKMETHGDGGVFAGKYKVVVLKFAPVSLEGGGRPESMNILSEMYESPDKTPFFVTVPHSGELRFELKSNP